VASADLGYYEKRPGSGIWYHPDRGHRTYEPRVCEHCGDPFMGERLKGRGDSAHSLAGAAGPTPEYSARHKRVERERGPANEHACIDCGHLAYDWCQTHGTDGLDSMDYEPRCRPCHRAYDAATVSRGERRYNAKVTEDDVREMRRLRTAGWKLADLASKFGVTEATVSKICRGEAWKHVKAEADEG
jgi:hypothetical protein